jgi:dihydrofolate reductase
MLAELGLITAVNKVNCIGNKGKLLFSLKEDMKRFKDLTTGQMVIMGRKTFESLPNQKPLPNRKNVVVTRNKDYKVEGASVVNSVEDALLLALSDTSIEKAFVIGGSEIYKEVFQYVDTIYLTEVDDETNGDTYFPVFDYQEWTVCGKSDEDIIDESTGLKYRFKVLKHVETI